MSELQLCHPYDDRPLKGVYLAEPKIDGVRALITPVNGLSRLGKELRNVGHLVDLVRDKVGEYVLDGELLGSDWNDTVGAVHLHSKASVEVTLFAFDILTVSEWATGISTTPYARRRALLRSVVKDLGSPHIRDLPLSRVDSSEQAYDAAAQFVKDGFEGAVIKDANSFYMFRRHRSWMKIKFMKTVEGTVVDVQEGTGKYVGMMGALIVRLPSGVICGVGTGFSDDQRREWFKNPPIDRLIEVRYQQKTVTDTLRFPSFIRMREDLE